MTCIICGISGAEYLCSIKGMGVSLCEEHMGGVSCDQSLRLEAA